MNSIKFRHSYALKLEFQNNVNSLHTLDLFLHVIHFSISFFFGGHKQAKSLHKIQNLSRSHIQIETQRSAVLEY